MPRTTDTGRSDRSVAALETVRKTVGRYAGFATMGLAFVMGETLVRIEEIVAAWEGRGYSA